MLTSETLGTGGGAGSQVGLETCTDADAAKQAASSVQNRAGEDCCKHDMTTPGGMAAACMGAALTGATGQALGHGCRAVGSGCADGAGGSAGGASGARRAAAKRGLGTRGMSAH